MRKITLLIALATVFTAFSSFAQYTHRQPSGFEFTESDSRVLPFPDARAANPKAEHQYQLIMSGQKNATYYEGFENWNPADPSVIPDGWKRYRTTALAEDPFANEITMPASEELNWFANNPDFYPYNGGVVTDYVQAGLGSLGCYWDAPDFTWAVTPEIAIPETDANMVLTFWPWLSNNFTSNWITKFYVRIFADGEWVALYSYNAEAEGNNIYAQMLSFNLNAFKGKSVKVAFVHEWNDGIQMAIDEVYIGEEINDDFSVTGFTVFPTFGLLPGTEVSVSADVSSLGLNSGAVEVSLLVNDEVVETVTTPELTTGGEVSSEFVIFTWTPSTFGEYSLKIEIPADDFVGNNMGQETVYVNHYVNLAEDFENFEFDELGIPFLVWPPVGWAVSDANWVFETEQWPIFNAVAGLISGRDGQPEQALITPAVTLGEQDDYLSFYLEGVNNHVDVGTTAGAVPQGVQGFSTFQLKYSTSPTGPWTAMGDPIPFENIYDENDNLIQSANGLRWLEYDISAMEAGAYYFAFTTTSTFSLVIGETIYRSFVMVDNVLVTEDPANASMPDWYQITIPLNEGDVPYKYFIVIDNTPSWDNGEWVGDPNRIVSVTGEVTVEDNWGVQPEAKAEGIVATKQGPYMVTFKVDMDGAMLGETAFDAELHKVFIAGDFGEGFSWAQPGSNALLEMTKDGSVVPVSVNEIILAEGKVKVFPNPASTVVSVNAETTITLVEIYSLIGSKVYARELNDNQHQINTETLENGIYIIKVTTDQGIATQKLQIAR
jgi:hypothetical protein